MPLWSLLLLVISLGAAGYLLWQLKIQRQLLANLQAEQVTLASAWKARGSDVRQLPKAETTPLISIEILNSTELAVKESSFAGTLNSLAPGVVRRMVYRRTAEILREELAGRGVRAEVNLHGLD